MATSQHFSLHQERLYLLSALAAEESRGEQFSGLLETLRAKLRAAESAEKPIENIKSLKKSIRSLSFKVTRCQKNERTLAANLAGVTSQMQELENYQWRTVHHDHAHPAQYQYRDDFVSPVSPFIPPLTPGMPMSAGLVPCMQQMSLGWPATPGHNSPYNLYHSMNAQLMQQVPPTLTMYPQTGLCTSGRMPIWHYPNYGMKGINDDEADLVSPADVVSSCTLSPWTEMDDSCAPIVATQDIVPSAPIRAMSLPSLRSM